MYYMWNPAWWKMFKTFHCKKENQGEKLLEVSSPQQNTENDKFETIMTSII